MKINIIKLFVLSTVIFFIGCEGRNPNKTDEGKDIYVSNEITSPIDTAGLNYADTLYVPIYSDIYLDPANPRNLLTAVLSIRNTSLHSDLYVSLIDYYNSEGELVRQYLKKAIVLPPMKTVDYYVDKDDDLGGAGANFVVALSSKSSRVSPVVQAVMINSSGNKSFAFTTDGYSISRK